MDPREPGSRDCGVQPLAKAWPQLKGAGGRVVGFCSDGSAFPSCSSPTTLFFIIFPKMTHYHLFQIDPLPFGLWLITKLILILFGNYPLTTWMSSYIPFSWHLFTPPIVFQYVFAEWVCNRVLYVNPYTPPHLN